MSNFKSIGTLRNFELKPLTILTGVNSCGKSSFIQALLLLKQTVEIDSGKYSLYLDGAYYSAKSYLDIIKAKNKTNKLGFTFEIKKSEFTDFNEAVEKSIFDSFDDYSCKIHFEYEFNEEELYISKFEVEYITDEKNNYVKFDQNLLTSNCLVEANNDYLFEGVYDDIPPKFLRINYSGIFPNAVELIRSKLIPDPENNDVMLLDEDTSKIYPNLNSVKSFIKSYFKHLHYIGPLRVEPKDSYAAHRSEYSVGADGSNVAFILEKRGGDLIEVNVPIFDEGIISFARRKMTLLKATNIWMCEVFNFGKKIYAREQADTYAIFLTNHFGIESTIKHVGFGISQVLPIVVQGLLLDPGQKLMLEQPEIHLHPKIQSFLFDFLYSLINIGKSVIIETHSDHFITRMRRRIAEDGTDQLSNAVKLTYVHNEKKEVAFKAMDLDEFGTVDFFPDEFIERPDIELAALLKAQSKKRIAKRK
ncbi:MAG TPA: AAA family ATPase [Mucilaginibacter sp.]|jgi:predicted ATPase